MKNVNGKLNKFKKVAINTYSQPCVHVDEQLVLYRLPLRICSAMNNLPVFSQPEQRSSCGNSVEVRRTRHHVTEGDEDTTQTGPE